MKILKFPDKRLFEPCSRVTVFGPELKVLLEAMWETMEEHDGLGLAANQVGLGYDMFVMSGAKDEKLFIVNPILWQVSGNQANLKEGCLSAPGEFVVLSERSDLVILKYQDETGKKLERHFSGLQAVCVQHEIDHLMGRSHLQSKSLSRNVRRALARKWKLPLD